MSLDIDDPVGELVRTAPPLPDFVTPAVLEFKRLEYSYLMGLSASRKKELSHRGSVQDFEAHAIHHVRHYGDFAFTLAGLKPCALFAHGVGPWFAQGLATAALLPVMQQFNLAAHGFQAAQISHRMLTSNPVHPGFTGNWVLANTKHPLYSLARRTFLDASRDGKRVPEDDIGRALGYPLPGADGTVEYMDKTEIDEREAMGQAVCCVPVAEYFTPTDASSVGPIQYHFAMYAVAWRQMGRDLQINLQQHPLMGGTRAR